MSYKPNDTSIGNAMAGSEYGYTNAPVIDDMNAIDIAPTGEQMSLDFLNEPFNNSWDESKKTIWHRNWVLGISPTRATAAQDAKAISEEQRKRAADQAGQRGKPMTSSEVEKLTQLSSVGSALDVLETRLNKIPPAERGPIAGRMKMANPYDTQAQEVQNIITSITPGLARGVFGEVGVLTEPDMIRYSNLLPNAKTPQALAEKNLANLRERLEEAKIATIDTMRKAKMDVSGFEEDYNNAVQARDARRQAAEAATAPAAQPAPAQLPSAIGGYVMKRPGDPDFDPQYNNGQMYYEEQ